MPQRTKREKIAAQQRKALKYTIIERDVPVELSKVSHTDTLAASLPEMTKTRVTDTHGKIELTQEDIAIKGFFLQDLQKSLLFIGGILTLEIILYFARISNYFLR